MKLIEHAKEGLVNLYFSKLRSILAVLGILVGTASVVAMVLGGEIATKETLKQFESLGTDLLAISINNPPDETINNKQELNLEPINQLLTIDQSIKNVATYTQVFFPVNFQGNVINAVPLGVTHDFGDIVKIKLEKGRFISTADRYDFYCVIGHDIYEAIKQWTNKDPIGQSIQIGNNIFIIVGIAKSWPENSFVYTTIDNAVMIPILASAVISKYATINNIIMQLKPNTNIEDVKNKIDTYLQKTMAGKEISYRSAKELISKMQKQSEILSVFLALIGSISLIVGGIGVMNIMLVSVVERRKEIGIRLAVGAKRRDISLMFLMEAIMLSIVGGIIGVTVGILIAYIIALSWHWQFTLFLWPPFVGFSVSVAVGIFFGFYPALMASRLNPIDALRTE